MPFSSGTFTRLYSWVTDKNNSINITASRMDGEDNGFATGLSTCLLKDGTQTVTADIPFGGFKLTGIANGIAATDAVALGQAQNQVYSWVAAGGTADAITAVYSPIVTALVDGMKLSFRATAANATTTPTFAPNGLTAHTITKKGGSALAANDIPAALAECVVQYNLANTRWELLNPSSAGGTVTSVALSMPGVFSVSGSPVTGTGTLTATASGTSGGVPYFSASNAMASSAALTANLPVIGGGAGAAPTVGSVSGNTTTFATTTGSLTSAHLAAFDASGNIKDGGTVASNLVTTALGVGSVVLGFHTGATSPGGTVAGSTITCAYPGGSSTGDTLSGTWQALHTIGSGLVGLWQRTV